MVWTPFGGKPLFWATAICVAALGILAPAAVADQSITSAGPLTTINVNGDLSCQVQHAADTRPSFFGTASCGTDLTVAEPGGTTLYGHEGTPFTAVNQSGVSGSGSGNDPFRVTTVADAGSTGVRVTQVDSYVVGQEFYRTEITVSSPTAQDVALYHAADCYLQDNDIGYGFHDGTSGGIFCTANPNNSPQARVLGFVPVGAGPSHFMEGEFDVVYGAMNGADFPDTCECTNQLDNGMGLSWRFTVPAGGSVRRALATAVSPTGVIPDTRVDTTPPDTPITIGPPFFGADHTPTFTFASTEAGSTFTCSIDGGPFVPCTSPFTTPRLSGGQHTFAVRATDAAGNTDPTPTVYTFDVAVAVSELPRPTLGKKINVGPVPGSGPVFIAVRGRGSASGASAHASQKGLHFVPLTEARQVPVGSFLNTKRGTVQLVSASTKGNKLQSGRFNAGLFQVLQSRKRREHGLTELKLKGSSFRGCRTGRRGKAGAAALRRRTIRRVRGNARGNFRTSGRGASATVRGTIWTLADRCDGTLTTVKRGKVAVRDFRKKRTILVKAGKSYLARVGG